MSFEKYIGDVFYDGLFKKINSYVIKNRGNLNIKTNNFLEINYASLNDFYIKKYRVLDEKKDIVTLALQVIGDLEVSGKTIGKYSTYETDNAEIYLDVKVDFRFNNGIHDFRILGIEEYDSKKFNDKKVKYSSSFIRYIGKNELDKVAEEILEEYYPEILENVVPLSVKELVKRLNLNLMEVPLTGDKSVFGKIVFKDSDIDVFSNEEKIKLFVEERTILVDPEVKAIRNEGSYNNTIVHECVHWIMHRLNNEYNFILAEKYGHIKINEKDREWIEWQANSIAPRLLMPKKTVNRKIQELHLKYTSQFDEFNRVKMYELVIDELSDFYRVSKLAAKIRLLQLGYPEYEGVYNYLGNEYLRSYTFEVDALQNNQTYTITFEDACYLNMFNENFRDIMDSRKYVYVDSHFCLNDKKYVRITEDDIHEMTDYAYLHMDECCLKFNIKSRNTKKKVEFEIFHEYVLNRGENSADVEVDFVDYLSKPCVREDSLQYEIEVNKELSDIFSRLPVLFPDSLRYHRKRKKITVEKLEEYSLVSTSTIKRLEKSLEQQTTLEKVIALCIGMKLYPDFSFDLIDKANCIKLNRMLPQHNAYKMILQCKYHWSIHECNEFLEKGKLKKII